MRKGYKGGWLIEEKSGTLLGINLGSDYCAEHEWGIKDLQMAAGIEYDESVFGIDRRRTKLNEKNLLFVNNGKEAGLIIDSAWQLEYRRKKEMKDWATYLTYDTYGEEKNLCTAWDGDSLGIRVKTDKYIKKLEQIKEALVKNDAAIWLGGGHVFQNAGLVIGIVSRIPVHNLQEMYDADLDYYKLQEAAKATGIEQKIAERNKDVRYPRPYGCHLRASWATGGPGTYHLSLPRLAGEAPKDRKTKHPVIFWLNPETKPAQYGWYTVEELELWLEGKGPVLEKEK